MNPPGWFTIYGSRVGFDWFMEIGKWLCVQKYVEPCPKHGPSNYQNLTNLLCAVPKKKTTNFGQAPYMSKIKSYIKPWDAKPSGRIPVAGEGVVFGIRKATWMLIAWWFMIPSWRNISRYILLPPKKTDISLEKPWLEDYVFFLAMVPFLGDPFR